MGHSLHPTFYSPLNDVSGPQGAWHGLAQIPAGGGKVAVADMEIAAIHHIALTVRDLERSKEFYREILSLEEIGRPPFTFPGAWFQLGESQQIHLIVHDRATFREKPLDTRDIHFAVRVPDY